ncbi:hypothetical protein [Gimesia panareensis]|uniref:hypothetical protein n=1 Tax=Gimesia panareensis TaxID=2527978 RepID=UPI0011A47D47|nr:hypothetical protein [Gimesia panareensis]
MNPVDRFQGTGKITLLRLADRDMFQNLTLASRGSSKRNCLSGVALPGKTDGNRVAGVAAIFFILNLTGQLLRLIILTKTGLVRSRLQQNQVGIVGL